MEKTKFLSFRRLCIYFFLSLSPLIGSSQSTLACNDAVQISLGTNCNDGEVSADMFLEGVVTQPPNVTEVCLLIEYKDGNGNTQKDTSCVTALTDTFDDIEWAMLIGKTIQYKLLIQFESTTYNSCWGEAIIEDKIPPVADCQEEPTEPFYVYKYDWPKVKSLIEEFADGVGCAALDDHCAPLCGTDGYDDVTVHYIPFNGVDGSPPGDVQRDEECLRVGLMQPIGTLIDEDDLTVVPTALMFEWSDCIEDNCQTEFDVLWELVSVADFECPPGGGIMETFQLIYYLEYSSKHGGDDTMHIAHYEFNILRPVMPEAPHNVTVYCDDGEELSPQGIADQYNYAFYCGEEYFDIWEDACTEEELAWLSKGCNVGIAYAYPHWEAIGDVTVTHNNEEFVKSCAVPLKSDGSHGYCKYFTIYEDQKLLDNCCTTKILRKWKVVDWCTSTAEEIYQVIERHDHKGPELHGEAYPIEVGIKPWLCYADLKIPDNQHYPYIEAWDACCEGFVTVTIHEFDPSVPDAPALDRAALNMTAEEFMEYYDICEFMGDLVEDDLSIGNVVHLSQGKYVLRYQAVDECGNEGEFFCVPLWVLDKTPPVPVCEDEVVASLTFDADFADGGIAKIYAESFDSGSHDSNCGDVCIEVIRMEDFNSTPVYGDGSYYGIGHGYGEESEECLPYYRVIECWEGKPIETQTPWGYEPVTCFAASDTIVVPSGYDKYGDPIECEDKAIAAFGEYVKFCCEDLGRDDLFVIVRVWDHWGNYNDCMVKVALQNKIEASIYCGKDIYYKCEDYPDTPYDAYLHAPLVDALCGDVELHYEDVHDFNECGYGLIYRYWKASFAGEVVAQCIQHVYVNQYEDYFDPRSIKWPAHHTGEPVYGQKITCVDGEPEVTNSNYHFYLPPTFDCMDVETCVPEWDENHCGLIGWSVESDTVYFEDAACVKVINRWTVIDWCTWDPNSSDSYDEPSDPWTWVSDHSLGDCGGKSCYEDGYNVYARFIDDSCVYTWESNTESLEGDKEGHGEFTCNELDLDGYYIWNQVIKVINTTPPVLADCEDVEFEVDANCKGSIILSNSAEDEEDCGGDWLKWYVELFDVHWSIIDYWDIHSSVGEEIVINAATEDGWDGDSNAEGYVEPGTYIVRWTVKDGCGNESVCIQYILVVDRKPPTPICHATISTAFMQPSGEVTIWATDFDLKSFDNCTPENELKYSIRIKGSGSDPASNVTITCDDLNNDLVELEVWVTDESGNSDYCDVTVFVSDDTNICDDTGSGTAFVSGSLTNEFGDFVENAEVQLSSDHPEYPLKQNTSDDGYFAFSNNPMYRSYELSATRDDDDLNGVSTLDLVLMQKHIIGLESLNSPYKVIAADVNNDSKISAADLVELRKLILGIYSTLPANTSWRFVDSKQKLDQMNPFPFSEIIGIDQLNQDMSSEDFVGVKVGDVTGDSKANQAVDVEVRSHGELVLEVQDQYLTPGDLVAVDFFAEQFDDVFGYQLTMEHGGLELQEVVAATLDIDESNVANWQGKLTMSWNSSEGVRTNDVLFTLIFKVMNPTKLSESLQINSSLTPVEAYVGEDLVKNSIQLVFRDENGNSIETDFMLYQNEPNPFGNETVIAFELPRADHAVLTVVDVTGKVVYFVEGEYAKGLNQMTLRSEELGATGVLYYRLESGAYSATKKMILIK